MGIDDIGDQQGFSPETGGDEEEEILPEDRELADTISRRVTDILANVPHGQSFYTAGGGRFLERTIPIDWDGRPPEAHYEEAVERAQGAGRSSAEAFLGTATSNEPPRFRCLIEHNIPLGMSDDMEGVAEGELFLTMLPLSPEESGFAPFRVGIERSEGMTHTRFVLLKKTDGGPDIELPNPEGAALEGYEEASSGESLEDFRISANQIRQQLALLSQALQVGTPNKSLSDEIPRLYKDIKPDLVPSLIPHQGVLMNANKTIKSDMSLTLAPLIHAARTTNSPSFEVEKPIPQKGGGQPSVAL